MSSVVVLALSSSSLGAKGMACSAKAAPGGAKDRCPCLCDTVPGHPVALEEAGNSIQNNESSRCALCQQQSTAPSNEQLSEQLQKVGTCPRRTLPVWRPLHRTRKWRTRPRARDAASEAQTPRSDPPAGSTQTSQPNACPTSAAGTAFAT